MGSEATLIKMFTEFKRDKKKEENINSIDEKVALSKKGLVEKSRLLQTQMSVYLKKEEEDERTGPKKDRRESIDLNTQKSIDFILATTDAKSQLKKI